MSCRQEASVLVADALASQLCAAQDALRGRERRLVWPVAQTTFTRVIASGNSAANARW